jgi:FtsH-binding integral membrane protein
MVFTLVIKFFEDLSMLKIKQKLNSVRKSVSAFFALAVSFFATSVHAAIAGLDPSSIDFAGIATEIGTWVGVAIAAGITLYGLTLAITAAMNIFGKLTQKAFGR